MTRSSVRHALAPVAWLLALAGAAPALAVVDSIETLVADSDAVVVASLVQLYRDPPVEAPVYRPGRVRATLAVFEVIKGTAPGELPLVVSDAMPLIVSWPRVESFTQWQRRGGRRLVFLVRRERTVWHEDDPACPLALRDDEWTLRGQTPTGSRVAAAQEDVALGFTMDFRGVRTLEQACAVAREAAAFGGKLDRWVSLPVPERAAWGELQGNRLRIPLDARAEGLAHQWAGNPAYAGQTIAVLENFPSDQNARALEQYLADNQFHHRGRAGKAMTWNYPHRARAVRALQQWGREVREPALGGPAAMYRPVRAWHVGAAAGCMAAAWVLARGVGKRRGRVPVASAALALACVMLVCLWLSRGTVHELTASIGDSRYWLSTYRGGVQAVRIRQWPQRTAWSYGRFDLNAAPEDLWNEQGVFATSDERFAGLRRMSGTMWGDDRGATYPYGSFTVPLPLLAALAGLLPAWRAVGLVRGRRLRRRRLLSGCCTDCGYNLKSAGERCPECGAPRPPAPYARAGMSDVAHAGS